MALDTTKDANLDATGLDARKVNPFDFDRAATGEIRVFENVQLQITVLSAAAYALRVYPRAGAHKYSEKEAKRKFSEYVMENSNFRKSSCDAFAKDGADLVKYWEAQEGKPDAMTLRGETNDGFWGKLYDATRPEDVLAHFLSDIKTRTKQDGGHIRTQVDLRELLKPDLIDKRLAREKAAREKAALKDTKADIDHKEEAIEAAAKLAEIEIDNKLEAREDLAVRLASYLCDREKVPASMFQDLMEAAFTGRTDLAFASIAELASARASEVAEMEDTYLGE